MKKSKSRQHRVSPKLTKRPRRQRGLRRVESLEKRAMLSGDGISPWHNAYMPTDVNADGVFNQSDVDILIGELRTNGARTLGAPLAARGLMEGEQALYLDVDNDGKVSQRDLLKSLDALMLEAEPAPATFSANYDLEIVDEDGNMVGEGGTANIRLGSTFTLNIYVEDTSADLSGFQQAFVDVLYDSSKVVIDDYDTDITWGAGWLPSDLGSVPNNVTPDGVLNAADAQFQEANKLKWMGGTRFSPVYTNPGEPRLLMSIEFRALAEATGPNAFSFMVDVKDHPLLADPADEVVAFNQTLRDGTTIDNPDENLVATYVHDDGDPTQTLELVRFTGGSVNVNISVQPEPGANYDSYTVNEDYEGDDASSTPPVIEYNGQDYYVLDVLANDRDSTESLVTGDRSRFNIDSVTQPQRGSVIIEDAANIPDLETETGITSHQVLLYQVPPTGSSPPAETFQYTITDSGATNNTGTTSADVYVFIENVNDAPEIAPIPEYVLPEGDTVADNVFDYVTDEEGDELTVTFEDTSGLQGTFTPEIDPVTMEPTGNFTYTSDLPGLTETVEFTVSDGVNPPVTGELTFRTLLDSLLEGVVYFDADNDGQVDDNSHNNASPEMRIGGVTVELVQGGTVVDTTVTDAFGTYSFANFDAGTYSVRINDPAFTRKGITSSGGFTVTGNEISGVQIGNGQPGTVTGLNFGYRGRTAQYIGMADFIASNTEDSIVLAFSKENGEATLEWYSVDEGWDRLVRIRPDYAYVDPITKNAQIAFEVSVEGVDEPQFVVQAFSTSTPGYMVVSETSEGMVIRINGSASAVLQNLAAVDAAFEEM